MKFKSEKEAQLHHIKNYNSDGVAKNRYSRCTSEYWLGKFILDSVPEKSMVLDVGCNTGIIGIMLKMKSCYVKGIEIVEDLVKKARINGVYAQQGTAEKLPSKDSKFDVVTCIEVLEHLHDPKIAIKEAYRVLKDGGLYVTSFPIEEELGDHHNHIYNVKEIQSLFKGFNSFKLIGIQDNFNLKKGKKAVAKWVGVLVVKNLKKDNLGDKL